MRNKHSLMRLVLDEPGVRERLSYGKIRLPRIPPTTIYARIATCETWWRLVRIGKYRLTKSTRTPIWLSA